MIDVIIPAYNAHETIKNTLMSLAFQRLCHLLDVYIIDDHSNTGYQNDIQYFLDNKFFHSLTIHRNEKNMGVGYCRNISLKISEKTNNPWIFFIDSDDYMATPYAFNQYLLLARDFKNAKVIYSNVHQEMDDVSQFDLTGDDKTTITTDKRGNILYLHGRIYNRKAINDIGLAFPKTRSNEDIAFNLTFFQAYNAPGEIIFDQHSLVCTNYNINSITRSKNSNRSTSKILSVNEVHDSYIACLETIEVLKNVYKIKKIIPTALNCSNFVDKFLFDAFKYTQYEFLSEDQKILWYQIHAKYYNDIIVPLLKNTPVGYSFKQQWFHNNIDFGFVDTSLDTLKSHLIKIRTGYNDELYKKLAKQYLTEQGYYESTL